MTRKILAIIIGVVVAFSVVMSSEWLGHQIWPLPKNLNWNDPNQIAKFMAQMPIAAYAWLLFGWLTAVILGVFVCSRVQHSTAIWPQACAAVLFTAAVTSNFLLLPHPIWFIVLSALLLCTASWASVLFFTRPQGQI